MLYALCGCSGAGKSTLLEAALQSAPWLTRLTTYTTRVRRPGEVHGRDYHFITLDTFQQYVRADHIVCPIQYRGEWYGDERRLFLPLMSITSQDHYRFDLTGSQAAREAPARNEGDTRGVTGF